MRSKDVFPSILGFPFPHTRLAVTRRLLVKDESAADLVCMRASVEFSERGRSGIPDVATMENRRANFFSRVV